MVPKAGDPRGLENCPNTSLEEGTFVLDTDLKVLYCPLI